MSVSLPVSPVSSASNNVGDVHSDDVPVLGRVLLVDDEESVLELEREILQSRRLTVLTARSGKEAIEVLEHASVDLVVTDMKMPGEITGRALYEWVREHRPALAIIVWSSQCLTRMIRNREIYLNPAAARTFRNRSRWTPSGESCSGHFYSRRQ